MIKYNSQFGNLTKQEKCRERERESAAVESGAPPQSGKYRKKAFEDKEGERETEGDGGREGGSCQNVESQLSWVVRKEGKRGQGEKQSGKKTERSLASGCVCVCVLKEKGVVGVCGWLQGGDVLTQPRVSRG